MLVFCFDEQGQFESPDYKGPLFIGGFTYDSPDLKDTETERERILNFFRKACKNANTSFPENLHPKYFRDIPSIKTKEEYTKYLPEFIKTGLYDGASLLDTERKGTYRFFIHLASPFGKTVYLTDTDNLYAQDHRISNRYDHMTGDFIKYGLFLNPDVFGQEVLLDFPSRLTVGNDKKGYELAGYDAYKENEGKYYGTEKKVFRSLLQNLGEKFPHKKIGEPGLRVNSITKGYFAGQSELPGYAFLMFADAVCSVVAHVLTSSENGKRNNKEYKILKDSLETAIGGKINLTLYDDVDEIFTEAVLRADQKDYLNSLLEADGFSSGKSREKKFYKETIYDTYLKELSSSVSDAKKKELLKKLPDVFEKEELNDSIQFAKWAMDFCKEASVEELKERASMADLSLIANGLVDDRKCHFYNSLLAVEERDYYKSLWNLACVHSKIPDFDELEKEILTVVKENMENRDYEICARTLDDKTRETQLDRNLDYIFETLLWIKGEREWNDKNNYRAAFSLYVAGIAIRNHAGRADLAKICLQQVNKLKRFVSEADYANCSNRLIVSCIDLLDFDSAFLLSLEKTKSSGNLEMEFRTENFRFETTEQAKDYSQLAQICSFMNLNNTTLVEKGKVTKEQFLLYKKLTESFFINSLKRFRKGSEDYLITLSYYLHFLVSEGAARVPIIEEYDLAVKEYQIEGKHLTKAQERKKEKLLSKKNEISEIRKEYESSKKKFEEYSVLYFGYEKAEEQLEYILSLFPKRKVKINPVYAFALWCKALPVFYSKKTMEKTMRLISDEVLKKYISNKHPWELICFYLAKIYTHMGNEKAASQVLLYVTDEMESTQLLSIIVSNARMEHYKEMGNMKDYETEKGKLVKKLKKYTNRKLPKEDGVAENIVTYTYC